jgi:lambda repressor-like predicted transcriptional regulator
MKIVEQLVTEGWSLREIGRAAGLSDHTVARALDGGTVYWSTAARLRAPRR